MSKSVEVRLWGTTVGYLGYPKGSQVATFEYTPEFLQAPVYIAPLTMKHPPARHRFETISFRTFKGIPGIFADSLPDKYGNQLIDQFMAKKQISPEEITTLDRLLYIGDRGMGALEYHPLALEEEEREPLALDLQALSELAELVLSRKQNFNAKLNDTKTDQDALNLIRVGSSAGGARSKALVTKKSDGRLYDGTLLYDEPCSYWLLKFDSVSNADRDRTDPKGMTKVEYIYAQIARACGIDIPRTEYMTTGDEFHFMIERFDRRFDGVQSSKLHYVSWAGMRHFDRDTTGAYSYEQLVLTVRELGLGEDAVEEIFRRAVFNIVGRNQDDHSKNFGFLMDKQGRWRLSPAFDLTYAYDPAGSWTKVHQIKLNGKQDGFGAEDIVAFGAYCNLTEREAKAVLEKTKAAFSGFDSMAKECDLAKVLRESILQNLRVDL